MKLDRDISEMSFGERGRELQRLRGLIRSHRGKRDNGRCWMNDIGLYKRTLPEGARGAGTMLLPLNTLLVNCKRYIVGQKMCHRTPAD
jgi:hypothetical protein